MQKQNKIKNKTKLTHSISIRLEDDLYERMQKLDELNWSAIMRKFLQVKVSELELKR